MTTDDLVQRLKDRLERSWRRNEGVTDDVALFDEALLRLEAQDAAIRGLLTAAETVLAGLNARIEAAPKNAVPVFDGIVDLSDAVHVTRAALSGKEPPR